MGEKNMQIKFTNTSLKDELNMAFSSVKDELDDHLTAVNENSTEIQTNFEYLQKLDDKIERLRERIDELFCLIQPENEEKKPIFTFKKLNRREKEIFAVLYILTETTAFVTYEQMAKKTNLTAELVAQFVSSMVAKGIPITKKYFEKVAYISLEHSFRQVQAKENIVGLDTQLTGWIKNN